MSEREEKLSAERIVPKAVFILWLEDCHFAHGILLLIRNVRIGFAIMVKASCSLILLVFGWR
ncbi:hypothetical protein BBA71_10780 [Acetobacter pasteurianus]|nr:hypothetical protein BBA71_10780 [Acetobacter pasteurianus]